MRTHLIGFAFLAAITTPAAAQGSSEFDTTDIIILVIAGCVLLFLAFVVIGIISWAVNAIDKAFYVPPLPPPSPEDYDQTAARVRAKARLLDADAIYYDSQTRAVLKQRELKEVKKFLDDQDRNGARR